MNPIRQILGKVGRERGTSSEARVLAACQLEGRPPWMVSARAATREEDHAGIDVVIESDVGKLFVQVKSSRRGKAAFLERRRRAVVGVVVASVADAPERLLAKVVGALAPIRKKYLAERA